MFFLRISSSISLAFLLPRSTVIFYNYETVVVYCTKNMVWFGTNFLGSSLYRCPRFWATQTTAHDLCSAFLWIRHAFLPHENANYLCLSLRFAQTWATCIVYFITTKFLIILSSSSSHPLSEISKGVTPFCLWLYCCRLYAFISLSYLTHGWGRYVFLTRGLRLLSLSLRSISLMGGTGLSS